MAKDPAILWYYNDYLSGTEEMTFEEQGAYMRLLCKQMDKGPMSMDFIKRILKDSYDKLWPVLQSKFKINESGNLYNERVEVERGRRKKFLDKQSEVGKKGGRPKNPDKTQNKPTGYENDNPNETNYINENRNGIENEIESENGAEKISTDPATLVPKMMAVWVKENPTYPLEIESDYPALKKIAEFICKQTAISFQPRDGTVQQIVLTNWQIMSSWIADHKFYNSHNLQQINKYRQSIAKEISNEQSNSKNGKSKPGSKISGAEINQAFTEFYSKGKQPAGA
jgi:uncharacterized protein YdaU (DUF1376 family)